MIPAIPAMLPIGRRVAGHSRARGDRRAGSSRSTGLTFPVVGALLALGACDRPPESPSPAALVNSPIVVGSDSLPEDEVRAYLAAALGFTSRGGQVFCSYEILGQEGDRVFLASVCEEFIQATDSLESGSGSRGPVALVLDTTGTRMRIVEHQVPGDGNWYAPDIGRIFPEPVQRRILERTDEHNRRTAALRAENLDAVRAHFRNGGFAHPAAESAAETAPRSRASESLVRAAEAIVGFLRGEVGFEQIRVADTVALCLGREGGGTCTEVSRASLRTPEGWRVHSDETRMTYPFAPPPWLTQLATAVGVHFRCFEYPLADDFPALAYLPHVGTKLLPPDFSSCLQSWNLTLVFAADQDFPTLVAAVYDQWEW
jgi:hypothetical protein